MTRAIISGAAFVAVLVVVLGLSDHHRALGQGVDARTAAPSTRASGAAPTTTSTGGDGVLYGRVNGEDGATYEGRLRFGGDEEAFWGNYFNGVKDENPWAVHTPLRDQARSPIEIFGFSLPPWGPQTNLSRPLMARFGDIARIDARGRDLRVTLKSGTVFHLDRFAADDFADGLRVWDARRGVVDLDEWHVRSVEFLPAAPGPAAPARLHGTVRTAHGVFTGFIQWDRKEAAAADVLVGRTADGERRLPFETVRSIARRSRESALVTLLDGRALVLSGTRHVGDGHRGIYVDDGRYGRVLVSWDAFERIDFSVGGVGPAYDDFPRGSALTGSVTTRSGRRLTGRLVYDLDESETTETLDAPSRGVDYTIPLGLIASIAPDGREQHPGTPASVTLHDGETLPLERAGDLGDGNAGMLIFAGGRQRPEYVPWTDVQQIDLDRPPAMYPRSPK